MGTTQLMSEPTSHPLSERAVAVPSWLRAAVRQLESTTSIDGLAAALDEVAGPVSSRRAGEALRGQWLGHALHPLLTDLPLGCWISAGLLDVVGGGRRREGARRLVALGLVLAVPTTLSGLAEFGVIRDRRPGGSPRCTA